MSRHAACRQRGSRQREPLRRLKIERLEIRNLLTASSIGSLSDSSFADGMICNCAACCGMDIVGELISSGVSDNDGPAASLSSLPQLSSSPGSTAKLYLDFNGDFQATWGAWNNVTTPVYDRDGDPTSFSATELAHIQEIWARVSEDFAPWNIDVTTIAPGSLANQVVAHIAIGGNGSWYSSGVGGVAYIGGFYNSAPNVGYVFSNNLSSARSVAECASHEAGHLFGLYHQSVWSGTTLVQEYNPGNSAWSPIMGNSYSGARSTWHNGVTNQSSTTTQDQIVVLANSSNNFGLRTDDFGNTIGTASTLPITNGTVNFAGLINRHDDVDVWQFTTTGGALSFTLTVSQYGPNLDGILELRDANNTLLVLADPTGSFNASISTTVVAGTYYLVARSDGTYGNMGRYTISGSVPQTVQDPQIRLQLSGATLSSGSSVNFGSVMAGSSDTRTFTVQNVGGGTLNLTAIDPSAWAGRWTLVSNLGTTQLAAGQSTQFTVRFNASTPGSGSCTLNLLSNDPGLGTFTLSLLADVTVPTWGTVDFYLAQNQQATGGQWFRMTASQAGWFSAEAYFAHASGNIDLEVYNTSYQLIGNSATSNNAERVDVLVTAGQEIFLRVVGSNASVTYRCTNLVAGSGNTINVKGTSSDDLFVFLPGSTTHRVAVNGVGYDFNASTYTTIHFDDLGGVDTLVVVGTPQSETVTLSATEALVVSSSYSFRMTGAEFIQVHAGEGNDTATMYDRAGNDVFTGSPTQANLAGSGYSWTVFGFDVVDGVFTAGGFDQAFLYGSIGDDRFEATPTSAFLTGPGYRLNTSGYRTVVAVGGWGNDIALLYDSAGDEVFIGDRFSGSLSGSNFYLRANDFDRVEARSSGGNDAAYLWDSPGDDYFGGSQVLAFFNGVGFSNYVEGFRHVSAISTGGNDTADLYDTPGDDRLVVNGRMRRMEADHYSVQTENFKAVRAYASSGNDLVLLQQLLTTDLIRGRNNWVSLINADVVTALGFDQVTATAKPGQKPQLDLVAIDYLFTKVGW
jgi:hypothetical protein